MILPKALKKNARIGIVSPSYWMEDKQLILASKVIEESGYSTVHGFSTILKENVYAGNAEERARNINDFFMDDSIDAIFCARGGYGANRVLPFLDFENIKKNPKIFIGYSDVTAIITSISQETGLITFHGPMLSSFKGPVDKYSLETLLLTLSGKVMEIPLPVDNPVKILNEGKGSGKLWGGNLTMLANRLGTENVLEPNDGILFIEETNEFTYAFDRLLYHLRSSGTLENIQGIIIGELTGFKEEKILFGKTTDEIVLDVFGDMDIPIISNFPCGHGKHQATLPISLPMEIEALNRSVRINFLTKPVS